jgi:hypothetical protein
MRSGVVRGFWLVVALLCSGCSATQLAYNQADLLARWELGRYLRLSEAQKPVFERHFNETWQWHRSHELPRYADELRQLAASTAQAFPRSQTEATISRYREHWQQLLARVPPLACELGPSLDPAQVERLLAAIDEDLNEYRHKEVERDARRRSADARRQLLRQLRRWLGSVTDPQRRLIDDWSAERPSVHGEWLAYRETWRDTVAALLQNRDAPEFCPQISALILDGTSLWSEPQAAAFAANREQWLNLFEQLGDTLSDAQRAHLRNRLLSLAGELEALATPAAGTPPDDEIDA